MKNKKSEDLLLKIVLFSIAIIPLVYFYKIENVPIKGFILGAGSWGFGNIFKILAHHFVVVPLQRKKKNVISISFINGFISGFFELLASYLLIILTISKYDYDYNSIICFGLAIGSLETIIVARSKGYDLLKGTSLEETSRKALEYLESVKGVNHYIFNLILPVVERIIATFLHISTRGLIFVTIITGNALPALIALLVFIIADGVLGYYYNISGKLATGRGYVQLHVYLFILALVNTIVFFILISPYKNVVL